MKKLSAEHPAIDENVLNRIAKALNEDDCPWRDSPDCNPHCCGLYAVCPAVTMGKANARIRELEMQLENCRLDAEGVANYIHEAKDSEKRADRLAVIADALATEAEAERFYHKRSHRTFIGMSRALMGGRHRAEAKLRELIDILEAASDEIFHSVDEYTGEHLEGCLLCRIEAALRAAKGE